VCVCVRGRARLEEARALQRYRRRDLGISAATLPRTDALANAAAAAAPAPVVRTNETVEAKLREGGGLVRCA
jgi:hypothetical protein